MTKVRCWWTVVQAREWRRRRKRKNGRQIEILWDFETGLG